MITEDYVNSEIAKLLEKKGFSGEFHKHYWGYKPGEEFLTSDGFNPNYDYPAPTIQVTMKWLREVHNIDICICREIDEHGDCFDGYIAVVYSNKIYKITIRDVEKDLSFEEAAEAAIKYCLTNLI